MAEFAAAPTLGKLAMGGRWEDAVVCRPGQRALTDSLVHLGESGEVACEAFFGQAFFGVRKHGTGLAGFVQAFAQAMQASDGPEFFAAVEELGVVLSAQFEFAELGAEGAWSSVGPLRITDPCGVGPEILWARFEASAAGRDTTHDKALEFTFSGGLPHWLALPVSHAGVLSRDLVDAALGSFCH